MILKSISINDYKSIREIESIEIDDITCLVGKNESGKTAILEAIYKLNPIIAEHGNFDVDVDYPKMDVEDYRFEVENGEREHTIVVKAIFDIEDDELENLIEDYGSDLVNSRELSLSKGYDNKLYIDLDLNEEVLIKTLLRNAKISDDARKALLKEKTIDELIESVANLQEKVAPKDPAQEGGGQKDVGLQQLSDKLIQIDKKGLDIYIYDEYLKHNVPKFLYFDDYYKMAGQVNIRSLMQRQQQNKLEDSDRPLLGLLELARLDLNELQNPDNTESLYNKLEGSANHLNKQVLEYWSQNKHIEIRFDIRRALPNDPIGMREKEGVNLWGRVYNNKYRVSTPLAKRSRGFVWFFSFLAWFSQQKRKNESLILLLDEPGLSLHAKAQNDLLRYIEEELKPYHQVIYSTHSPFMVDSTKFERIRIVEDKSMDTDKKLLPQQEGTKVLVDVLEPSEDSLFPLQGALGYELHQTLFIGPNSLIVEGVSDLLYIQVLSGLLESSSREGLDPAWVITPVGGFEKVSTFAALIGAQSGMNVATLIDIQKKDAQQVENLYKRKLLQKKNVLTYGQFTGSSEADVEDMFDPDFYLQLVNEEYKKDLSAPLTIKDLPQNERIIVRLEEYFAQNHLLNQAKFNHYRPARFFVENISSLQANLSKDTLDRFENAFKAINKLL